jgi:outer membrane protein assembly complex protein YaeT
LAAATARAQDLTCTPGQIEVGKLRFTGNRAFTDNDLENAIITTPSSWARRTFRFLGSRRCLDHDEFPRDRVRLEIFYRKHGYYQVNVDTLVRFIRPGVVAVTFAIREGSPVVIDSLALSGLTGVRDSLKIVRELPVRARGPGRRNADTLFDRYAIDATRDTLQRRLRSFGYPFAQVLENYTVDTTARASSVEFHVIPGAFATIGSITITSENVKGKKPQIPDNVARSLTGLKIGEPYRAPDLIKAQRNLYETDAYRRVEYSVTPDSVGPAVRDTQVDVNMKLQEDYIHSARAGAGYGTIDCFRLQGQYVDKNFLDDARHFDLTAGVTKIGIGYPLGGLRDSFCAPARGDIYSDSLNYHVAATIRQPSLFGARVFPTLTLFSERRSEYNAYIRSTPVGLTGTLTLPEGPFSFIPQYSLQYGRTSASPALLCAVFNLCVAADQATFQKLQTLSIVGGTAVFDTRNNALLPSRGVYITSSITHSGTEILSSKYQQFTKITGNAAVYFDLAHTGNVLALRASAGTIFGTYTESDGAAFVPLDQRLYAGGPTTVRGFPQNQLGPVVYVTTNVDSAGTKTCKTCWSIQQTLPVRVVPTGGNLSEVGNAELRLKSPFLPQYVGWNVFVDVGRVQPEVQNAELDRQFQNFKATPGVGLQLLTPIGPLRVDVGYNSYPQPFGPAYYLVQLPNGAPSSESAQLPVLCVSPGNTIPVSHGIPSPGMPGWKPIPTQPSGATCEATFAPPAKNGFFNRLNFNFSIGPAF